MPDPVAYRTKLGINVFCDGIWKEDEKGFHFVTTDCYDIEHVEAAIDLVIDELVWTRGKPFTYKMVYDFLEESEGRHDIFFKELQMGEEGSCATLKDEKRACTGFPCGLSPCGWCHGTHSPKKTCEGNDCVYISTIRVAKNNICFAKSSLVHELIHFFQYHIENESDPEHVDVMLWPRGCTKEKYPDKEERKECKENTMVRRINGYLSEEYCWQGEKDGPEAEQEASKKE